MEQAFNIVLSQQEPHCSVCSFFSKSEVRKVSFGKKIRDAKLRPTRGDCLDCRALSFVENIRALYSDQGKYFVFSLGRVILLCICCFLKRVTDRTFLKPMCMIFHVHDFPCAFLIQNTSLKFPAPRSNCISPR